MPTTPPSASGRPGPTRSPAPPPPKPTAEPLSPAEQDAARFGRPAAGWRRWLYTVIFESDTPEGKAFDVALIWAILLSVGVVMLDSVATLHERWSLAFSAAEWGFTLLFTVEYLARLLCVRHPLRYAFSFYGLIDLLAVAPTFLAVLVPELHALIDVRILRLLRVIRIFKLTHYARELRFLSNALAASARKIAVFLSVVVMLVVVLGTVMYVVEGPTNGYTSIPMSVYWAITTLTTVGYGDITPKTDLGRAIASLMMLLGWGVLAVPTGIVTAEMTLHRHAGGGAPAGGGSGGSGVGRGVGRGEGGPRRCIACQTDDHQLDSHHCRHCGSRLPSL
jgi:voltage-gated potassium channel